MRKKNKNKFEFGFPKPKHETFQLGDIFAFVENKNQVRKKNKNKFEFGFPKPNSRFRFSKPGNVFAFAIVLLLAVSLTSVICGIRNRNLGNNTYKSNSEITENRVEVAGEEIVSHDSEEKLSANDGSKSIEDKTEGILSNMGFEKIEIEEDDKSVRTFWKNDDLIFVQGKLLRIASNAITSKKINRHAIEAQDIDTNSITSRTIRDNTIKGEDIDDDTNITINSLTAETVMADNVNGIIIDSGALSEITTINMSGQLTSTLADGVAPFVVASTTVNTNFNADLLDGQHGTYYATAASISGTDNYIPRFNGTSALENSIIYDNGTSIGIGTTVPGGKLDILASSGSQLRLSYGSSIYADFTVGSTGNLSIAPNTAGATTTIGAGTDVAIKIDSAGNVGIGTTAPVSSLSIDGNVSIGNIAAGTDGIKVLVISNGNAPSTSPADSIQLYSEDVSDSSELKVRDEAGNITTLSPHNFSLIPEGRSEDLAWSYYSQRGNEAINVDMTKAIRLVEQLTGEQLIYLKDLKSGEYKRAESEAENLLALKLLADQKFSIDENADTIETLKKSANKQLAGIELELADYKSDIFEQIKNLMSLQDEMQNQINEIDRQNNEEEMGLIEARLGNIEIALNVSGNDINVLGNLSVSGNIKLLEGKITVKDIEAFGLVEAEEIKTKILGITSEKTSGKAEIEAGSNEKIIETFYISENSKIYITIEGSNYGKVLYYDEVIEGESFKIKFDGNAVGEKIKFNWMIVK